MLEIDRLKEVSFSYSSRTVNLKVTVNALPSRDAYLLVAERAGEFVLKV